MMEESVQPSVVGSSGGGRYMGVLYYASADLHRPPEAYRDSSSLPSIQRPVMQSRPEEYEYAVAPPHNPSFQQQQQQQQYQQPPPAPQPYSHYVAYQNGQHVAPNGQDARYAIPPQPLDARQMTGGRHKKEVKRRTKTGCMTCRKRRIKCDEGQPVCRNCQKSKRDCLGYDPIFKSQSGSTTLQPAPGSATDTTLAASTVPSNPYRQPSQQYTSAGASFVPYNNFAAAQEHDNPLDVRIASGEGSLSRAQQHNHTKRLQSERRAPPITMERLYALDNIPPRYTTSEIPPSLTPPMQQEVSELYNYHYAVGLDKLFETSWYSTRGLFQLTSNQELMDFVAQCTEQFRRPPADPAETRSLEARLVWQFACLPRLAVHTLTNTTLPPDPVTQDVLTRVDIVETLLTGQYLSSRRVPPPPPGNVDNQKHNELSFWHHLGYFVSLRDDHPDETVMSDISKSMAALRGVLNMLENRDVLYSIAIARHLGGRMPASFAPSSAWQRPLQPGASDEDDAVNKVLIAQRFVESEEMRGTTQVMQRVCAMAIRAWGLQKQ